MTFQRTVTAIITSCFLLFLLIVVIQRSRIGNFPSKEQAMEQAATYIVEHDIIGGYAVPLTDSTSTGGSLPWRAVLIVEVIPFDSVVAGDQVVFHDRADLVVHHAIYRTRDAIQTKGRANVSPDPDMVTRENYRGIVVKAIAHR